MIFEYLSWMIVYLYYMDVYLEFFFHLSPPPLPLGILGPSLGDTINIYFEET